MKTIRNILLSVLAFTLFGCEEIVLEDDNTTTDSQTSESYFPDIKKSEGVFVKLADYLFASDLVEGKTFYFDKVYSYAQNEESKFDKAPDIFQRSFIKVDNGSFTTVTEFKESKEKNRFDIYEDKIFSYEYDPAIELPAKVAKNDKVYEVVEKDITKRCVVKYIGAKDLLPVLPLYVQNDLKNYLKTENGGFLLSQFNFASIMHIYCGTTDRHTTDIYYSNKFGQVLKVEKDIDKDMLKVEVVDVESVRND